MLTELLQELRNWFDRGHFYGKFKIENGVITSYNDGAVFVDGQYIRIIGSLFNDGVWKYGEDELMDETFDGAVWALGIPQAVISLSENISAWQEKYGGVDSTNMSPYSSESFGGYSYSKSTGQTSSSASSLPTWQAVFADDLNRWRKI